MLCFKHFHNLNQMAIRVKIKIDGLVKRQNYPK